MGATAEAERFLNAMRAARIAGDLDAATDFFDEDAVFTIVGLGADVRGKAAIRDLLSGLIAQYEFLDWRPIQVFVDGDDIAVRHHLTLRHGPSGKVVETQTSEFLSMRDGRCRSFTQYVDTALVSALNAA